MRVNPSPVGTCWALLGKLQAVSARWPLSYRGRKSWCVMASSWWRREVRDWKVREVSCEQNIKMTKEFWNLFTW